MELTPMLVFSILLPLLPLVDGGCSYSQEGKDTSTVFKDMDAARLAAKMALAHQGVDIDAYKAESKRMHEAEPYVPQFYTAGREPGMVEEEEKEEEVVVPEGAIWDLSSRSNKNSPKQEIGRAPNTSERHHENIEVSTENKKETVPVYRGSGMDDKVVLDVAGEEKVWEVGGEESPSGCPHAKKLKVEKEKAQEAEKPAGCPFSHEEL